MEQISTFQGEVLCDSISELGEGSAYDAQTDTLWWFDIIGKKLHELPMKTRAKRVHDLPLMASVWARVDDRTHLLATERGLFLRDAATGELTLHAEVEPDKPGNRSNDGRMHASGSLWIGTMGKRAEAEQGSIYHVAAGTVTKLFGDISIPNCICFSPDGATGYFVDTKKNQMMKVAVDPATGLPKGSPLPFIDSSGEVGGMDGAVCDAKGQIWNARWGAGKVDCYAPSGERVARYALPVSQPSCPVFFGRNADCLAVTTAWEGMDEEGRKHQPQAGALFDLGVTVEGRFDPAYRL